MTDNNRIGEGQYKFRVTFVAIDSEGVEHQIIENHRRKDEYELRANALNWAIEKVVELRTKRILDRSNYDHDEQWYKSGSRIAWFDRREKVWTTYLIDENKYQRTAAQHYANKWQFEQCEDAGHFDDDEQDLAEAIANSEWG